MGPGARAAAEPEAQPRRSSLRGAAPRQARVEDASLGLRLLFDAVMRRRSSASACARRCSSAARISSRRRDETVSVLAEAPFEALRAGVADLREALREDGFGLALVQRGQALELA